MKRSKARPKRSATSPAFRKLAAAAAAALPALLALGVLEVVLVLQANGGAAGSLTALLIVAGTLPLLVPVHAAVLGLARWAVQQIRKNPAPVVGATVGGLFGLRLGELVSMNLFMDLRRADLAGLLIAISVGVLTFVPAAIAAVAAQRLTTRWAGATGSTSERRQALLERAAPALVLVTFAAWALWRLAALRLWVHVPWTTVLVFAVVIVAAVAQLRWTRLATWAHARSDRVLGALFLMTVLGWTLGAGAFPERQAQRLALERGSELSRRALPVARALLDWDGDGYSSSFGGGDCDDGDPERLPHAFDPPGDGIDQDCFAGDTDVALVKDPFGMAAMPTRVQVSSAITSVVLIVMDGVRFDATGASSPETSSTPNLDRLAGAGVSFTKAYSPAPGTWPSVPSMLTGRYPMSLEWDDDIDPPGLNARNTTLAEVLTAHGFRSHSLVSLFMIGAYTGLWSGFTTFQPVQPPGATQRAQDNTSELMLTQAKEIVGAAGLDRTFFYFHFMDAHSPYDSHPGIVTKDDPYSRYLGEVRWVDQHVGELISFVQSLPGAESTLIVVTADHGEEFLEHGNRFHASQLYEESLRVPLVMANPRLEPSVRPEPVSLVDLVPTILDLCGIPPTPDLVLDGRSLAPDLTGRPPDGADRRLIFADHAPWKPWLQTMVVDGRWKLFYRAHRRTLELYDLLGDPAEATNLADDRPEDVLRLGRRLGARLAIAASAER